MRQTPPNCSGSSSLSAITTAGRSRSDRTATCTFLLASAAAAATLLNFTLGFLVVTIPIFYPLAKALGFDPIWYTVVITLVTTMGAVTPPVGVNVYIVSGLSPDIPIGTIFRGVSIFLIAYVICLALLIIFPQVALFLPGLLM